MIYPSEEARRKAELSRQEAESLIERELRLSRMRLQGGYGLLRLPRAYDHPLPEAQDDLGAEPRLLPQKKRKQTVLPALPETKENN